MVELGALMRCIGNFGSAVLIKLVQLSHDCQVVELLVERSGGSVATKDLGGQSGSLLRRGVLGELDVIDDAVNDLGSR